MWSSRNQGCTLGILVGGESSRMGGFPKGLLPAPGPARGSSSLVARLASEFRAVEGAGDVVLLGAAAAYTNLGMPMLPDAPPGIGPLGGLRALLAYGRDRRERGESGEVLLCSCDLPFLSRAVFSRLLLSETNAIAVALQTNDGLQPFPSRYDALRALPLADAALAQSTHSLRVVLASCDPFVLSLAESELSELDDWDTPDDRART